ncbi:cuticle protein 19.8-like isoform X1 [Homarus americanus]|uniref:cuticle protein 19.8-like isoform X1 n=1 Tax=Homarus americanus TaxID=6706 RepID=UPI001C458CF4|nr:cuticle protein 19.8-like isoform X1 [Homarus americanus]
MTLKVVAVLAVVTAAVADSPSAPLYFYTAPREPVEASVESPETRPAHSYSVPKEYTEKYDVTKYDFDWSVQDGNSGNDFVHQEDRDNRNIKGSYTVQLPDGRLQTVTYYVDGDSGYVAKVKYEGEAQYSESSEYRQYKPPTPRYTAPESEESVKTPVYTPPRRLYTAPELEKTTEAPVYTPPRRVYTAPESEESVETPVYTPPRRLYTAPESEETTEAPVYTPPRRLYTAPESEESMETPVYTPPRRRYTAPESEESMETPVYTPPRRRFTAPESEESLETPVYTPPKRLYTTPTKPFAATPYSLSHLAANTLHLRHHLVSVRGGDSTHNSSTHNCFSVIFS